MNGLIHASSFAHARKRPHAVYFYSLLILAIACLWISLRLPAEVRRAQLPQQSQPAQNPSSSAAQAGSPFLMDGGAGPCSIDLKVMDPAGKPISTALISVHVAYGTLGLHKLDMSVYSSPEGTARFTGIPPKPKNAPLEFRAVKDQLTGEASMNPATECQAKHDIVMDVRKAK